MDVEQIKALIAEKLPDADIAVTGGDGKYQAVVISGRFRRLETLKRHRMVYAAVDEEIRNGSLHALTIVTRTPEEAG